jgi:hypothetical protein
VTRIGVRFCCRCRQEICLTLEPFGLIFHGYGVISPGVKRSGREANHSTSRRSRLRKTGVIPMRLYALHRCINYIFLFSYVLLFLCTCILIVCLCMVTLTEVFPCFFLSCLLIHQGPEHTLQMHCSL